MFAAVRCCFISFLFISKPTAGGLCPTMLGSRCWMVDITTVLQVRLAKIWAGVLWRGVERRVLQAPPTHITTGWPCSPRTLPSWVSWGSTGPPSAWHSNNFPARQPPVRPQPSPSLCCTARAGPPPPCSSRRAPRPAWPPSPSTSYSSSQPPPLRPTSTTWLLPCSLRSGPVSPLTSHQGNGTLSSFPPKICISSFTSHWGLQITYWLKEFRDIQKNFIAFFSAIELLHPAPEKWSVLLKTPNFNFNSFQSVSQGSLLQTKTVQQRRRVQSADLQTEHKSLLLSLELYRKTEN